MEIISAIGDETQDTQVRRLVAQFIVRHLGHDAYCITTYAAMEFEHREFTKHIKRIVADAHMTKENALCVAVGMQRLDLIHALMQNGAVIWTVTEAFGSPLIVAFESYNLEVLELVMNHMDTAHVGQAEQDNFISDRIIEQGNTLRRRRAAGHTNFDDHLTTDRRRVLPRLIERYLTKLPTNAIKAQNILFQWCLRLKNTALLERLLATGVSTMQRDTHYPTLYYSHPSDPDIMQVLHDHGILDVRGSFDVPFHVTSGVSLWSEYVQYFGKWGHTASVLHHAACHNDGLTVARALELGAHPDGPKGFPPLRIAIAHNNLDMIELLLEQGAGPEPDIQPNEKCILGILFANRNRELERRTVLPAVFRTLERKAGRLFASGEGYSVPEGHVQCYVRYLPTYLWGMIDSHRRSKRVINRWNPDHVLSITTEPIRAPEPIWKRDEDLEDYDQSHVCAINWVREWESRQWRREHRHEYCLPPQYP